MTPFTKPLTFATVDLSKDDDEETVAVAMKSIKESKNSYYGRNRDLVFKIPDTSFVDLFDDENETVNLRKSILSSTLASERVKNISESMSSSSLKTITSSDIQPVNSLKDRQSTRSNLHDIESICKRYTDRRQQRDSLIREERET